MNIGDIATIGAAVGGASWALNLKKYVPSKNVVKSFIKDNRWFLLRMGLVAATFAIMPDSACFAEGEGGDSGITVITSPLEKMQNLMTGPVPKAIVTIGAAIGGASWALNIENQIVKTAMRVVGGGSVALAAGTFVSQTAGMMIP